jgi:hypothetical protein
MSQSHCPKTSWYFGFFGFGAGGGNSAAASAAGLASILLMAWKADRIHFSRRVALSFHGQDMQELRTLEIAHVL